MNAARSPGVTCPTLVVRSECWCSAALSAKLAGRRSAAEPDGQLGGPSVSGAGGGYPRLLWGRSVL